MVLAGTSARTALMRGASRGPMGALARRCRVNQVRDWGPGGLTRIAGWSLPGSSSGAGGGLLEPTAKHRQVEHLSAADAIAPRTLGLVEFFIGELDQLLPATLPRQLRAAHAHGGGDA